MRKPKMQVGLVIDAERQIVPAAALAQPVGLTDGRRAVTLASVAVATFAPMTGLSLSATAAGAAFLMMPTLAKADFLGPDGVRYNTSCEPGTQDWVNGGPSQNESPTCANYVWCTNDGTGGWGNPDGYWELSLIHI